MNKRLAFESNLNLLRHTEAISGELNKIIEPLLQNLPFVHFSYLKISKNGQYLMLSNDLKVVQSYLDYRICEGNQYFLANKSFYMPLNSFVKSFWPLDDKRVPSVSLFRELSISNGMNIFYNSGDYVEVFVFGASIECERVTDIYLNHYYILERFIMYFKAELAKLIDTNDKGLFALSGFYKSEFPKVSQRNLGFLKQRFFQNTEVDKFYLEKRPQTYLTKKESECLYYLCLGKSVKQISSILDTSHRTTEKHLENIKAKCNLRFLDQIINLCHESGIDKLHLEKC